MNGILDVKIILGDSEYFLLSFKKFEDWFDWSEFEEFED